MFGRKGQGAMEYLMTYGWAILVVMIVGIVMWQLGIFNMGSTTTTASGFSKIKPQLAATAVGTSGAFQSIFTNGAGTTVDLTTVAGVPPFRAVNVGLATCSSYTATPQKNIGAGRNFRVTASGCGTGLNVNDVYNLEVTLNYQVNVAGITTPHSETGILRGPVQAT